MYLLEILFCTLFVVVSGIVDSTNGEDLKFNWPTKYTFKADKISLTAGWVEDIQYWRTKSKSRVDYNKGAVKYLKVKPSRKKRNYGVQYEVHPETTKDSENYIVCTKTNGTFSSPVTLDDILPYEYSEFDHVGSESIEQDTAEKFSYTEESETKTLWATYNLQSKIWTPIRYEIIKYDQWLDSKQKHEIWDFHNFYTEFNITVFEFDKIYDCEDTEPEDDNSSTARSGKYLGDRAFNSFKESHNKIYAHKKEHALRSSLFQKRMSLVLENNSKNTGYKLAINKFADRTPKEMKRYLGLIRPSKREAGTHSFPYSAKEVKELASTLPSEFDLRDGGYITPVRDQEECGSCWTFGTTSAVEGALARKNGGRLLRLSNQALLDCGWGFGLYGCNGGNDISAYRWMMEYGLPAEEEYGQYANRDGFCNINNMTTTYPIRGFTNVTPYSVEALKVALVNHGPLSVSIHATDNLFLYKGGIYYDSECEPDVLNHEVTLVGYGQRNGEEFWIIKNSWGQNWGVDGYFHLSVRDNNCGTTTEPSYPVL